MLVERVALGVHVGLGVGERLLARGERRFGLAKRVLARLDARLELGELEPRASSAVSACPSDSRAAASSVSASATACSRRQLGLGVGELAPPCVELRCRLFECPVALGERRVCICDGLLARCERRFGLAKGVLARLDARLELR